MKIRITAHDDVSLIGMVFDVVYYDFSKEKERIAFKCYDGRPFVFYPGEVRIIFENMKERADLESYVFEKAFKKIWT